MKLQEGLEELRENLLRDDAELASGPSDSLWTTRTLIRYLKDAQNRWCRRTLLLRDDATPKVCEVVLEAGVTTYKLHRSVRAVVSGRYEDSTTDLTRTGHVAIDGVETIAECDFPYDQYVAITGAPRAFSTDESLDMSDDSSVILRVFGTPTAAEDGKIIRLRVARMPLKELTEDDTDASFEIPDEFCLDMLEWAAYRALRTSDIDGHSTLAEQHKVRFDAAVLEAKKTNRRKLDAPIRFRFGMGGTSWS